MTGGLVKQPFGFDVLFIGAAGAAPHCWFSWLKKTNYINNSYKTHRNHSYWTYKPN
jgi:hypothetical protein